MHTKFNIIFNIDYLKKKIIFNIDISRCYSYHMSCMPYTNGRKHILYYLGRNLKAMHGMGVVIIVYCSALS